MFANRNGCYVGAPCGSMTVKRKRCVCFLGLARSVYDGTFGHFPAKNTVFLGFCQLSCFPIMHMCVLLQTHVNRLLAATAAEDAVIRQRVAEHDARMRTRGASG